MLVELQNAELAFGADALLDRASLVIERGRRVCIVGRNGCGKSTLLSVLNGTIRLDDGVRRQADGIRISLLGQEANIEFEGTAFDLADEQGENPIQTSKLLDRLSVPGDKPYGELSGGLKRRAELAGVMGSSPDLLLLDEPTNHLDPETIEWLEKWLQKPELSLVFISHDRRFINNIATDVIELDRGHLHHYKGNFERFIELRDKRLEAEERQRAQFEKYLAEEEAWIRTGIKARRTRNQGRVRRLESLREEKRGLRNRQGVAKIEVEKISKSGKSVLEVKQLCFAYDSNPIIENLDLNIMRGDRLGVMGANGSGKTTLIDLLVGKLQPVSGTIKTGSQLEIAVFDQHREKLNEKLSALDNVSDGREYISTPKGDRHIISYLQDFLFTPEQARGPITRFSGGERARLLLAKLFSRPFNFLILDEPTNDLDIETLELLEDVLSEFSGTVIIISHDREFLDNVTTSLLYFSGNAEVEEFFGGYDEYLRVKKARKKQKNTTSDKQPSTQVKAQPKPKKLSYKLQRELDTLPAVIERFENDIEDMHTKMAGAEFYNQTADVIADTATALEELEAGLLVAFSRWEELEKLR